MARPETTLSAAEIVARATEPLVKGVTVDLTNLVVETSVDLSGAVFGNVDFTGSTFMAPVICRGATFGGIAWFDRCHFASRLDLSQAVFCNDLRLRQAIVDGDASLSRAELRGIADLDRARFQARADLDSLLVLGSMSLDHAVFSGPVTLQGSELLGGLWCEGAEFRDRVDFRDVDVHGRTWLKQALLGRTKPGSNGPNPARDIRSFGYRWT